MDNLSIEGPRIVLKIPFGDGMLTVSETFVNGFIVTVFLSLMIIWLGSKLEVKNPTSKKQAVAEMAVKFMNNLVDENLGEGCRIYAPYLSGVFLYVLIGALIGLLGFRGVPADISVTGTLAAMTFCMITYSNIKSKGFLGYLNGIATPLPMTPMNIIGEIANPVSMAFRLFGNIAGGAIITTLIYASLAAASSAIYGLIGFSADVYYFNILQIGLPAMLSIYFDLFAGVIQSFVFIMLTMAYVKNAKE